MDRELPDVFDCRPVGHTGERVDGRLAAERMLRVAAAFRTVDAAQVKLLLVRDVPGRWLVEGSITVALEGRCQRCLEWMPVPVAAQVAVTVIANPGLRRDDNEDCVDAPGGKLALVELIEDEILLAIPMMLAHEQTDCGAPVDSVDDGAPDRRTPFAGLAALLEQKQ